MSVKIAQFCTELDERKLLETDNASKIKKK